MRLNASSGRSKLDMRTHCKVLSLRADDDSDAALLAAIYRALIWGDRIVIETLDGRTVARVSPKQGTASEAPSP